ncbi:MAG: hypothetical protein L3J39_06605 [Verrucomicrobiales bacterium]|nr:hypothetical protein [Verrucomicrobiales bacterium]
MKFALLILMFCLGFNFCGTLEAEQKYPDPWLPRPEMIGDWDKISERFMKWEIADFEYGGGIADGGSKGFSFKTSDGAEFDVLVVCSAWWTKEDHEKKRQPIYLWFENKIYRVEKGDKTETRLLVMLKRAAKILKGEGRADPKYIERLYSVVESRSNPYAYFPITYEEVEEK